MMLETLPVLKVSIFRRVIIVVLEALVGGTSKQLGYPTVGPTIFYK
jgi:hypothetical protein